MSVHYSSLTEVFYSLFLKITIFVLIMVIRTLVYDIAFKNMGKELHRATNIDEYIMQFKRILKERAWI